MNGTNFKNAPILYEFHYLFICKKQEIKTIREKFIPIYYTNIQPN